MGNNIPEIRVFSLQNIQINPPNLRNNRRDPEQTLFETLAESIAAAHQTTKTTYGLHPTTDDSHPDQHDLDMYA